MRLRAKRRASRRAAPRQRWFVWLLPGAVLASLGWLWWTTRDQTPRQPPPPPVVFTRANLPTPGPSPILLTTVPPAALALTQTPPVLSPPGLAPTQAAATLGTAAPAAVLALWSNLASATAAVQTNAGSDWSQSILEAQVALTQRAISPGSVDGVMGSQTRAALRAFQRQEGLPVTGALDEATQSRLTLKAPSLTTYAVTSADAARLRPLARSWLGKSLQSRLDYETLLELVAEKSRAHPNLIRRLNPDIDWTRVAPGTALQVPNTEYPPVSAKAAYVQIDLAARDLQVFDADHKLLAFFPCSIAQRMDKRPVGELRVVSVAANPNYTFNPRIFPESTEARELDRKLLLQPGPNNPVGVVWIGLNRPGYGIHGTPSPEQVGRTESHGCFRLANWNAEYLRQLAWVGLPVFIRP
jgi:lipoprotein-anchoring transpeptidase ErfK/SrfK